MILNLEQPWTQGMLLHEAVRGLEAAGIEEARRNAEWMLGEVLAYGRAQLYAFPEQPVSPAQVSVIAGMLERRMQREPLQYILGHTDFFGLRLKVTPAVLIPRPETEQVVEAALGLLQSISNPRILDVGTGSGCMALALKQMRPEAEVYACDVSRSALAVAAENAEVLGLSVSLLQADVLDPTFLMVAPSQLDLIVSNPPYIADHEAASLAPEVRDHEPHRALFAGSDPLVFYRAISRWALHLLKPKGYLVFEGHADYAVQVAAHLQESGFENVTLQPDYAGYPRILTALNPGSSPGQAVGTLER